ncbi:MAG: WYL domain-containing protein [Bacillota bacterium]|nr:WYL domain-containing protein [Bacillota bacterium]
MEEKGKKTAKKNRSGYSNSYRSLEAIWTVLKEHASKEHPLTVQEICDYLEQMEEAPSADTVKRLFPKEKDLINGLYPGTIIEADGGITNAYQNEESLHVVVENAEGYPLYSGKSDLEIAKVPFRTPSYSTVDKILKDRLPVDLNTFPYRIRCVAKKKNALGKVRYVSYDDLELNDGKNNLPRRYYLANVLTDTEWRILSDLIQVYPYLSERQTKKFLNAFHYLSPHKAKAIPNRYAHKRGSEEQFGWIRLLDEAIRQKKKVRVVYGEYVLKRSKEAGWEPKLQERKNHGTLEMEPYALMWSNGYYYLIAKHRGMMNLRVDRILKVEILEEGYEIPGDFDPIRYRNSCPVMYPGKKEFVRMRCSVSMLSVLMDFFGSLPQYSSYDAEANTVEVTMMIAADGVKLFAMQYADAVEVLEPKALREEIRETWKKAVKKYEE